MEIKGENKKVRFERIWEKFRESQNPRKSPPKCSFDYARKARIYNEERNLQQEFEDEKRDERNLGEF